MSVICRSAPGRLCCPASLAGQWAAAALLWSWWYYVSNMPVGSREAVLSSLVGWPVGGGGSALELVVLCQ